MSFYCRTVKMANVSETFDVVVVGAGIFGSCTAYHCQKLGLKTLLLEKYELGHSNGSSHGLSRIIRYAHVDSNYVPLVNETYRQIEELENKTKQKLWRQVDQFFYYCYDLKSVPTIVMLRTLTCTGELRLNSGRMQSYELGSEKSSLHSTFMFGAINSLCESSIAAISEVLHSHSIDHEVINGTQREFANLGGETREHEEVLEYHERPDNLTVVKSSKTAFHTKKVIFTVGPWIKQLFPNLPLHVQPESIAVCYWSATLGEDSAMLECEKFPVFISSGDNSKQFEIYGLPSIDYPGCVKICSHHGEPIDGDKHPDVPSKESIDVAASFIKEHVPILNATQPEHVDKCNTLYLDRKEKVSEDCHYIIGPYPGSSNVLIGGCGSGSGFKVAPGIGKVLAEMASGSQTSIDVSFFSFERFLRR
ncbi:sarcosine oxidase, monomeric form [Ostertagia ostertagi]